MTVQYIIFVSNVLVICVCFRKYFLIDNHCKNLSNEAEITEVPAGCARCVFILLALKLSISTQWLYSLFYLSREWREKFAQFSTIQNSVQICLVFETTT